MRKTYDISGYSPLRPGTRIQVLSGEGTIETAVIIKWSKVMGQRNCLPAGYEPVRFESGGRLMVHRDDIVVVDNRQGYRP